MDFLKKHGEKVLFVVLLVALAGSVFLAMSAKGNLQKGVERSPNAKKGDILTDATGVQEMIARLTTDPFQLEVLTDAFTPGVRVICMNPADRTLIPKDAKICPYCGWEQTVRDRDSDGDGIYDKLENTWGLNPNDPKDVLLDQDNDGFSTLVEFESGTDPSDSTNYPPLIDFVRLGDVEQTSIDFMLQGTAKLGSGYTIQIYWKYPDETQGRTEYIKVGNRFGRNNEFLAESFTDKREQVGSRFIDRSRAVISSGRYNTSLGRVGDERYGKMTESSATLSTIRGPEWSQNVRVDQTMELDNKSYKIVDINTETVVIKIASEEPESAVNLTIKKATEEELESIKPPEDESSEFMPEEMRMMNSDFF